MEVQEKRWEQGLFITGTQINKYNGMGSKTISLP